MSHGKEERHVEVSDTNKLFELMYDIRDRVTRIEEGQKRQAQIEEKADNADATANEALQKAVANEKEIKKTQDSMKWSWGLFFAFIIAISAAVIKLFA